MLSVKQEKENVVMGCKYFYYAVFRFAHEVKPGGRKKCNWLSGTATPSF